jgi:predicted DNA-binding transcriptional regulator AlpA
MADCQEVRFLRLRAVQERVGLGKTKIYALIKGGDFPPPRHEGRICYWPDSEIHAWQMARLAQTE